MFLQSVIAQLKELDIRIYYRVKDLLEERGFYVFANENCRATWIEPGVAEDWGYAMVD
jgi:hypothetical protein